MYLSQLTSPEAAELTRSQPPTVLLLPVGAIEPHGPHAPLATDVLISESMCRRAAERLMRDPQANAVILPPLPYGVTRYANGFAGAIDIAADTLHSILTDICTSLNNQGFQRIVLVNNHFEPEQVAVLRQVVDTMAKKVDMNVGFLDLTRRRNAAQLTAEFQSGACHAGRYETSLVLADHPELVRPQRLDLPEIDVNMPEAIRKGHTTFTAMGMEDAYCGAPAQATAKEGEATLDTLTDMLIETIRDTARC